MNLVNTRILQRYDTLQNWQQQNPILLDGELAVVATDNQVRFKIGDSQHTFNELNFIDQLQLTTISAFANILSTNNAIVGFKNSAGTHSIAVGSNVSASSQHAAAFGYKAATSSNGSFVFNGDQNYLAQPYYDNGEGTFNINPVNGLSGFYIGNKNLKTIIDENAINSNELSNYLDKREGGEISGDVDITQHIFKILSGNFIQTSTPDNVYVYSADNSFIQAQSTKYGSASIGSRGFIILGVTSAENKVVLSTDGTPISDIIPESCYTSAWSIALDNYLDAQFSEISTVGADYVIFKKPFNKVANANGKPESYFIGLIKDDNALYCPTHPEIGNCIISTFTSNHIEGGSTHATAQFAHAEGRATTAEGRYSHAEGGNGTTAGGVAAHAEGFGTKALGNSSHAEGSQTSATGMYAHAEGFYSKSLGDIAHAEGLSSYAAGTASHAEGFNTHATGNYAHAEGFKTHALGKYAHAEGEQTQAVTDNAHAAGFMSYAGGWNSTAIGRYSKVKDADHNAFVWQGVHQNAYYESKGLGTFCINPKNGLSGFYIGSNNLCSIIDNAIADVQIPTDLSAFTNSPGYLTAHQSLSNYYTKSETSSANEISTALTSIDVGNKVFIDDRISGIVEQTDLSIVYLSSSEYEQLSTNNQLLSNALYIVEDSFTNNYGKQIKNVAEPTLSTDAATKAYVDNIVNQQTSALIQRIQALENQLSGLEEQLHTINNG